MFDGRTFALGATLCLASAVAGYIFWGPSDAAKRRKRKKNTAGLCPGLLNTGTSCFLNANLQALAPCVSFCKWMSSRTSGLLNRNTFAVTLNRVLTVLNRDADADEEYCPSAVIDGLKQKNWVIPTGENDSHELFMAMVTTLNEDTEAESTPLFDLSWVQDNEGGEYGSQAQSVLLRDCNQNEMPEKPEMQPLRGHMANLLGCKMCQYKYPVRCEPFEGITLNIPPTSYCNNRLSLETLLRFWSMPETIQGASCENCKSRNTVMVKMAKIAKLPQTLSLNIQQVMLSESGIPIKNDRRILFPEVLPLGDYIYRGAHSYSVHRPTSLVSTRLLGGRNGYKIPTSRTPNLRSPNSRPLNLLKARNYYTRNTLNSLSVGLPMGPRDMLSDASRAEVEELAQTYHAETATEVHNTPYKLVSVIVHIGNASTGHFITYRRAPARHGQRFPHRWLFTSDTVVREASLSEVMSAQPYMLFYERI